MKSPFKFLDSYTKDDREIFFGREREIEELYHRIFESKIMLVYGVSGTGKSSLIHCGLSNKFSETDWLPLVVRRGANMNESMATAIGSSSLTAQQSKFLTPADFRKGVRSLYLDHYKPVFFIFDQFEELFIFGDKEERSTFIQIVKTITESDLQCRFIFVMREEYMAGISEFEKFIPTIFSNRVRVEKMSHLNAIEAIKQPCKVFNINIEEGFAESLLGKLSPCETDVELTYLQVFLDKIFRLSTGFLPLSQGGKEGEFSDKKESIKSISFTTELLHKTGNVSDLLGDFLDEQVALLDNPDTALILLKSFISVKGTKQPMQPEEAREYALTLGKDIKEHEIREMIQTFVNLRILCDKDQSGRYELRHDALAAKIYEKFTMAEKELLEVRKYIENAFLIYEKRGVMLNKQDLDYLSPFEKKLILPQNLSDFVNYCHTRLIRQKKTLTNIARISAIIFILIVAALGRKYIRSQNTLKERGMIGKYLLQSEINPLEGLQNTLHIWEKYNTSSILKLIIYSNYQKLLTISTDTSEALYPLQKKYKPLILDSSVIFAEINEERNCLYGFLENNQIFTLNLLNNNIIYFDPDNEVLSLEISVKDSLIAAVFTDSKAAVFDFTGSKLFEFETTPNGIMEKRLVRFFPSGNRHIAVIKDSLVIIYNFSGEMVNELAGHADRINSVDISPDGSFISTVSNDKTGLIWSVDETPGHYSIFDTLTGHKDIIWSCEFSKSGKYILTASADSTIRIWNLFGRQLNPWMGFAMNYKSEGRYRLNNGEADEDRLDPNLSAYYSKNCNASFSHDEMSIIATSYTDANESFPYRGIRYEQVVFHDGNFSKFSKLYWNPFISFAREENESNTPVSYDEINVSPAGDILTGVIRGKNEFSLIGPEGLKLCKYAGSFTFFSADGSILYYIDKERVNMFPVDIKVISNDLENYKINFSYRNEEGIFTVL